MEINLDKKHHFERINNEWKVHKLKNSQQFFIAKLEYDPFFTY